MANQYVNKVIVNGQTQLDLTGDTVDAAHLAQGFTAHDKSGAPITGTMEEGSGGEYDIESVDNGDGTQTLNISDASGGGGGTISQYAKFEEILSRSIKYFTTKLVFDNMPNLGSGYQANACLYNCQYFSIRNYSGTITSNYCFGFANAANSGSKKSIFCLGNVSGIGGNLFVNGYVDTLILMRTNNIVTKGTWDRIKRAPTIYVPPSLVSAYKADTKWAEDIDRIKGYSEAPTYDTNTQYEISNVCKHNGKFYAYCKEDLQSSTGQAPSGTSSDNAYWEYISEVNV